MKNSTVPRGEHPNPQFFRETWLNLNGEWEFEIDYAKSGKERGFETREHLNDKITVPFCPESRLSGIGNTDFMECVWYKRSFTVPESWTKNAKRTLLHIGACDYRAFVWVNGKSAGSHRGGSVGFTFDITEYLCAGENSIVVCAEDMLRTENQPAGKQSKQFSSYGCFYTRTTGIWQTVWLENVPSSYISSVKYDTGTAAKALFLHIECENSVNLPVKAEAFFDEKSVGRAESIVKGRKIVLCVLLDEVRLWSPETPYLYDLKITLGEDSVMSYFGMRDISCKNGALLLNGKTVFQRMVLDQGFYPDGIWTAPNDAALKEDIRRSKALGFNGARLHQKVFEPRFLYHCDREGYLVWGEYPNWGLDLLKPDAADKILNEWIEILNRDYNHPSIIGWCPLNEIGANSSSTLIRNLYRITETIDSSRLYIESSGWTHKENIGDIIDIHDYEGNPEKVREKYACLEAGDAIEMLGCEEKGIPTFISEYGGFRLGNCEDGGWGYGEAPQSEEEWLKRYSEITEIFLKNSKISGFCYTQLTDVEQEQNGLYTYERKLKFNAEKIREINSQSAKIEEEN